MKDHKIKKILGIDIGGTNIRAGIVDEEYQLSDVYMGSSAGLHHEDSSLDALMNFVDDYFASTGRSADAISIGFPSTLNKARDRVLNTPNIKGMNDMPVVEGFKEKFSIPVVIERDVNLLFLNDLHQLQIPGDGVNIGIYLGTGLGNAIAIDGKIYIGKTGSAAELGHIPSRDFEEVCSCGNVSCVEMFASGKYLQELANRLDTPIGEIFETKKDDSLIVKYVKDIAVPIATEINILDPEHIVLGGGVLAMKSFPIDNLIENIHSFTRKPYPDKELQFFLSKGGQESGIIGAGIHAFNKLNV